jgi:hypothetical protein
LGSGLCNQSGRVVRRLARSGGGEVYFQHSPTRCRVGERLMRSKLPSFRAVANSGRRRALRPIQDSSQDHGLVLLCCRVVSDRSAPHAGGTAGGGGRGCVRRALLLARIWLSVMVWLLDTVSCLAGLSEDVDVRDPPRALPRNNLIRNQGSWQTWLHVRGTQWPYAGGRGGRMR